VGSKYKAIEKWIEEWGIMLDWEAKAELRKAVGEAVRDAYQVGINVGEVGKEGTD